MSELERVEKELKRACPYAIEVARYGADPYGIRLVSNHKLKKNVKKLIRKYSRLLGFDDLRNQWYKENKNTEKSPVCPPVSGQA